MYKNKKKLFHISLHHNLQCILLGFCEMLWKEYKFSPFLAIKILSVFKKIIII